MFRGITAIQLDIKGRMAMPARYREQLLAKSTRLILTIDTESPCLLLYPFNEWEMIERKIEELPSFNGATRRIQRLLIGHATELEMDSSGRILLPPLLRDYAMLDKRIILVGQGKKFELWDEQKWADWLAEESEKTADLPTELQSVSL